MTDPGRRAALDLGTARTRLLSGGDTLTYEPSAVPADPSSQVTGAADAVPDGRWRWPVRHGIVTDPPGCARLARRVLSGLLNDLSKGFDDPRAASVPVRGGGGAA
ncbi:hypothetical protein ABZU75_40325 [Streptosporangium sp. NPDC005286]|uniref:hypothetical protein n=1 Tax=Streptosporangium sp. NPDC005286 TaxID=3154463 RepID=UPI0033A659DF